MLVDSTFLPEIITFFQNDPYPIFSQMVLNAYIHGLAHKRGGLLKSWLRFWGMGDCLRTVNGAPPQVIIQ